MSAAPRVIALFVSACIAGAAFSQSRIVTIPAAAKRATMTFQGTPELQLNGTAVRLAPGARIFDRGNFLQVYGAVSGTFVVKYLLEATTGLVQTVWILTDEEIVTPDPKPAE